MTNDSREPKTHEVVNWRKARMFWGTEKEAWEYRAKHGGYVRPSTDPDGEWKL